MSFFLSLSPISPSPYRYIKDACLCNMYITLTATSRRAVNTFTANKGNKAGGLNLQDKATLESVVQSDIRAAGMINIPVCAAKEAYTNWTKGKKKSKAKFYPCN